jgi:hypothetical protein
MRNSLLLVCAFLLFSCEDEGSLSHPDAKGDIIAYFQSHNDEGSISLDPQSAIAQLIGRANRYQFRIDNGKIHFKNVPAGTYTLRIEKKGPYDLYEREGIQHLGGSPTVINTPDQRIIVAQKPALEIQDWQLSIVKTNAATTLETYFQVDLTFLPSSYVTYPYVVLLVGDKPGVSPENYQEVYIDRLYYTDTGLSYQFFEHFFGHRLIKGRTYYAKLYPYNGGSTDLNTETGRTVIPSLGKAGAEISFVME